MEKQISPVHRGKVLHEAAKNHQDSIKKIVAAAGFEYSTFFTHTNNRNLPFETLAKYAKAMNHDFSKDIPEFKDYAIRHHLISVDESKVSYRQLELERDSWRDKYYSTLEKLNECLEKQSKS